MTHTLHRRDGGRSLDDDFVVLTLENRVRTGPSRRERLSERFPRLYGWLKTVYRGLRVDRWLSRAGVAVGDGGIDWTKVLHSREELRAYLARLRDADTGRSVVVSGVIDEVDGCLRELDLAPHTVQMSAGPFGRTDRLPSEETLAITMLCGHHLIPPQLVERQTARVAAGETSAEAAAEHLGGQCLCRIFNTRRAAALLEDHAHRS